MVLGEFRDQIRLRAEFRVSDPARQARVPAAPPALRCRQSSSNGTTLLSSAREHPDQQSEISFNAYRQPPRTSSVTEFAPEPGTSLTPPVRPRCLWPAQTRSDRPDRHHGNLARRDLPGTGPFGRHDRGQRGSAAGHRQPRPPLSKEVGFWSQHRAAGFRDHDLGLDHGTWMAQSRDSDSVIKVRFMIAEGRVGCSGAGWCGSCGVSHLRGPMPGMCGGCRGARGVSGQATGVRLGSPAVVGTAAGSPAASLMRLRPGLPRAFPAKRSVPAGGRSTSAAPMPHRCGQSCTSVAFMLPEYEGCDWDRAEA